MAAGHDGRTLRILLLGKTGSGKSTLSNALLGGGNRFHVGRGVRSETKSCDWDKAVRKGIMFEVTDTPGLCDTYMDESLIYKELAKSVAVAKPGPNIILFVLRADRRFTLEERHAYETIKLLFSEQISKYLIIVFNGIDEFGWDLPIADQREGHKKDLDQVRRDGSDGGNAVNMMLVEADERYIGLNNRTPADAQQTQVQDLVNMMLDLNQKNQGDVYRSELTHEINKRVEELIQPQPGRDTPRRIIEEDVPKEFFQRLVDGPVRASFEATKRKTSELCSVM